MSNIISTSQLLMSGLFMELFVPKDTAEKSKESKTPEKPKNKASTAQQSINSASDTEVSNTGSSSVKEGFHLISKGETLYKIANDYGISVSELIDANKQLKNDKNGNKIIHEGDLLKLPENIFTETVSPQKEADSQTWGKWTIEKGKGAFSIMSKFNLYEEELKKLNPDINFDSLKVGAVINVPGYRVKSGDTLDKIAKEHDITVKMLRELNPGLKSIKNGIIINVPKQAEANLELEGISVEKDEYISDTTETYTVQTGDTLYRIAKEKEVPVWALMLVNDIKDPKKLNKDQVLEIPSAEDIMELEQGRKNVQNTLHKSVKITKDNNLSVISSQYGVPVWALVEKNKIENPNKLSEGQIIEIPTSDEIKSLRLANAKNKSLPKVKKMTQKIIKESKGVENDNQGVISSSMGIVTHHVKPKDTLTSIAKEYGVDVKDIVAYNNLQGKSLTLPLAKQKITNIKIAGNPEAVMQVTGVSREFIDNLISLEKKSRTLYDDGCGFLTIGIGHNTKAHKDIKKYKGRSISDTEMYSLLARDIIEAQNVVKKHLKEDFNKLSQKQKEALYSLIFNTGGLNSCPKLIKAIKDGNYALAAQQFDQVSGTVNGKKQVMPGLIKRRFSEIALFVEGSNLSSKELQQVMTKIQNIYNRGFASIENKNNRVDYNAYTKKFLGNYIDKGFIKIKV